jgi:hypothetical protein
MRRVVLRVAAASVLSALACPAMAFDRLPQPNAGTDSLVITVADLDRTAGTHRIHRADAYWHWRYRAAYVRWMHNEYVRAGYPVRHRQFRTYARVYNCCTYDRHW